MHEYRGVRNKFTNLTIRIVKISTELGTKCIKNKFRSPQ